MKRMITISVCSLLALIFIVGIIYFVLPQNSNNEPQSTDPKFFAEMNVPLEIKIEQGTSKDMFVPSITCSTSYTLTFTVKDEKIATIENNKIKGLKIGNTIIKTTISHEKDSVSKYTDVVVYERTQDLNIFVSDSYGEVDKIYHSSSPSTYYFTILDEQVENANIEYSSNVSNFTLITQETKKLVYSFEVCSGEYLTFAVSNNSETKTITLPCEKIEDENEKEYYFSLSLPSAFKSTYLIENNTITITGANFIPLIFKIVNSLGEEYPNSYLCNINYSTNIDCLIEKENNSITISTTQTGTILLTLTSVVNCNISTTFTIVLE